MQAIKTPIYQTAQIREMEQLAIEKFAVPSSELMQRAGRAAFDFMMHRWPHAQRITVFCGTGNNGGDGYVLAKVAHDRGLKVTILQVGEHDHLKPDAQEAYEACHKTTMTIAPCSTAMSSEQPDVIVDAILGTGLIEDVRKDTAHAIRQLMQMPAPILSIDVPSGINADTGQAMGEAVSATETITFIGLKLGLLTGAGIAHTGKLALNDLQLPGEIFLLVEPIAEEVHFSDYARFLKPRTRDWHKGLSGHVLIIGGTLGFSGAARMAAEAALRVGAGLVSVATRPEHATVMNLTRPEIMCHGVADAKQLAPLLERADVVVLGPGLGQSEWAKSLWQAASATDLPLVVDADGLNILASQPQSNEKWILTPHPGEAARLLEETTATVQKDRLKAAIAIQGRYRGVCVLKGAGSLILAPHSLPALCDKGNPGMATAGMGDILSGVIGGLVAQHVPLAEAAKLGVYIHAVAGDFAAREGGERGLMATDLLPYIRKLVNREC